MKNELIPFHSLPEDEFLLLERIETADKNNFKGYHRHHFYEILWFTNCESQEKHSIDFKDYTVSANQIYILTPNQVHTMKIGSKEGFLLAISPGFFDRFFEVSKVLLTYPYFLAQNLSPEIALVLKKLMVLIEEEYHSGKRKNLLEAYLTAFLIHITTDAEQADTKDIITNKVLRLVEKHFINQKEVKFYAEAVSLSIRRINEIMVATTGMTVKQIINTRTLTMAKRYIAFDSMSSKEIAFTLGFNDPAYFSRIFKQRTGKTPEQFRKLKE